MNPYTALRQRQQQEVRALPIRFAFGDEQFAQMMHDWGLDPDRDVDQICSVGAGCYMQEKDWGLLEQLDQRHRAERAAAIAADPTGNEFIYWMFLRELSNYEYGYTGEAEETLDALGLTWEEVCADKRLHHGFEKASKQLLKGCYF